MNKRLVRLQVVCAVFAVALLIRLADLQLLRREEFIQAAEENRIRIRSVRAPRGKILDRTGIILASNRLSPDLIFVAAKAPDGTMEKTAERLAVILEEDSGPLLQKMRSGRRLPLWPVVIARDLPGPILRRIAWYGPFLPGIEVQLGPARTYPQQTAAAHALGYIGEISSAELEQLSESNYELGDWIGKSGIERLYDLQLRGEDGLEQFEADPLGQPLRLLSEKHFVAGQDIHLTLDADLCRWANEALSGKEGAIVAIEPATGRVLCLASTPAFDPAIFVDRNLMDSRVAVLSDALHPLVSRAWNASYPPGSTYKIIGVIAGLTTGRISPSMRYSCGGSYMGKKCWKLGGHGSVDLYGGLAQSCDVYFYHLSEAVGIEALTKTARALGMDLPSGLGLGTERSGLVPTPEWERAHVRTPDGQHWGTGDLMNTVIGQGYVLSTPIQVARLIAAAALGGKRMKLGIVEKIVGAAGEEMPVFVPAVESDMQLDAEHARIVRKALIGVVEGERGTAVRLKLPGLTVGGKTGTAENPHGENHGWIIGIAPLSESGDVVPRIAIAVLVVHGKSGSAGAGPLARYVLERWAIREGYVTDTAIVR